VVAAPVHGGGDVTSLSFTADGRRLATCGADGAVVLWDVTDPGRPRQAAMLAGDGAKAVMALAADGSLLVVGRQGGTLTVWDVVDPSRPVRLTSHTAHPDADVTALAFDPTDSTVLASGGSDGLVVVWDLGVPAAPDRAAALNDHRGRIEALAFSPDGHVLATGSADTTVGLWTIN
jgi:WD40 repeat protein